MPLGTEIGLGYVSLCSMGYISLCSMWSQLPSEKRAHPPHPIFGPCLLWANGWMDEDAAWYGSRPRPRPHCTRRGPSSLEMGTAVSLLFGPCLLWPRSPISATAELVVIMAALGHYIFALWYLLLLSIFFPRLISAVADWMSAILAHMVRP